MRRLVPALCLAVVVTAAGCSAFGVRPRDAATVNGVAISNGRLKDMVEARLGQQQNAQSQTQSSEPPDIDALTRQSLEGLIQFQIVLDGARQEGVTVKETDVDARLQQAKAEATAQGARWEDLLRSQSLTEGLLRDQFRVQLAVDLVAVKLVPYASDAQLLRVLGNHRADYLQVHVRHVLVKDKATAAAVRQQLVGTGDWAGVARRQSIDAQTKNKAGDLGFISKGQTTAPFERAELDLADAGGCKGKTSGACTSPISQPVHTQYGYHILQVLGVRLPRLDNNLRSQLDPTVRQRRQQAVQRWFESLVKQADVVVNPRYGRWDAASGKVLERANAPGASATTVPAGATPSTGP